MRVTGEAMQRKVLTVLRDAPGPRSAYDILAVLRDGAPRLAAPTVYRALAALQGAGRAHRVESLNAWVACEGDGCRRTLLLSICARCGAVEEISTGPLVKALSEAAAQTGFRPDRHVLEAHGVCASCAQRPAARDAAPDQAPNQVKRPEARA